MAARSRRARLADVHELAMRMPHVTIWNGSRGNPIYQVGGKSFVFFRTPRRTPSIRPPGSAIRT
jgi:hypothetical protein